MKRDVRKKEVRLRKNFFPTLIITLLLWTAISGLVYFVEPDTLGAIPTFFILLFLALLLTFSTLFANSRRGIIATIGLTLFLILRYLGVGNILNFLLILGLGIVIEIYFWRT